MNETTRCKNMVKTLAFALAASTLLPVHADVVDAPYIVSDGVQAVDTGYCPKLNSRFEIDFQFTETNK